MKCKYCDNKAVWKNPYNNSYYCDSHADEKVNQLIEEYNDHLSPTKKDWFIKIVESDPDLINVVFTPKGGNGNNAYNNWESTDI